MSNRKIRNGLTCLAFWVLLGSIGLMPSVAGTVKAIPTPAGETCSSEWRRVKSPSPAHREFDANQLSGVYALSSTDAWAVGWSLSYSEEHYRTLALHWDGVRWRTVPTPNSSQPNNYLQSVSATGPNDVWAVGQQDDGAGDSWSLVEHWDGKTWTIDKRATRPGSLGSVIAFSPSDAWAGGFGLERWDATGWKLHRIGAANYLRGLAGTSHNLWSVGYRTVQPDGPVLTMVEHWDGSAWIRESSVNPLRSSTDDENVLNGVAAIPGDDRSWAVGYFANFDGGPRAHTLIERWDGRIWNRVAAPNPGGSKLDNELWDVTALASSDAWAVGVITDGGANNRSLIERWDGKAWTTVASPSHGILLRITSDRKSKHLWAVGATDASNYQATLITEKCEP
jgi:hypothetical protein